MVHVLALRKDFTLKYRSWEGARDQFATDPDSRRQSKSTEESTVIGSFAILQEATYEVTEMGAI